MEYTKEYFIEKFEALKSEEIGTGDLKNHCALYHCGVRNWAPTLEANALSALFGGEYEGDYPVVYDVNDGNGIYSNSGSTPKERILNKLKSL